LIKSNIRSSGIAKGVRDHAFFIIFQKTEDRRQKMEDRRRKTEEKSRKAEDDGAYLQNVKENFRKTI